MQTDISRRRALALITLGLAETWSLNHGSTQAREPDATLEDSTYRLEFTHPLDDLIGDLLHGERGDPRRESETPHHDWYSAHTYHKFQSWGPTPRRYAPLEGLAERSLEWKRERVIATAARFIGYEYQHHHIPDWDPPADWPWKHCCAGRNGRGVDCSNFTSFVYNQGFGIHMNSGIERQSELHSALEGHHEHALKTIELPADYQERQKVLHTGDLLFIRGKEGGHVTHVILWVGNVGRSKSGVPLILDSHGDDVHDDAGRAIPCGIHLRPFRENSWYNRCASHAHRVFHTS